MPASAFELLAQRGDRSLRLMARNGEVSESWMGLTNLLATLSEENGWLPERMTFASPHMKPDGTIRFRFSVKRGPGARYYSSFGEDDFGRFLANTNAAVVEFLTRCRTWRRAFDTMHVCLDNFAVERGMRIEGLKAATGRARRGLAWFRVFTNVDAKVEDSRWNASHKSYR